MKKIYATALCFDPGATLDDLREAVTTFEEVERIARQMLGGSHPYTEGIAGKMREARATLRAREMEIPGLATVLDGIRGAMGPAAAWCERQGVVYIYDLKELGDEGAIDDFMNAAGLKDFQKKLVKKRIMELTRPPPLPGTPGAGPPAPAAPPQTAVGERLNSRTLRAPAGCLGDVRK